MKQPRFRAGSGYWFVYHLPPSHWPLAGTNTIRVDMRTRAADVLPPVILRDVECEIRYLRGQAFHRDFVDPDLGGTSSDNM